MGPWTLVYERRGECLVFGGISLLPGHYVDMLTTMMRDCEALQMDVWSSLSSMRYSRAHFTPCCYNDCLYLVGRLNNNTIEIYSLERALFLSATLLRLPEKGLALAYMDYHCLTVLSANYLTTFNLDSLTAPPEDRFTGKQIDPIYFYTHMPLIVDEEKGEVYITILGRFWMLYCGGTQFTNVA